MHRIIGRVALAFALLLEACAGAGAQPPRAAAAAGGDVTSPEAHLGRPLGRDFELADWNETSGYYRRLAEESPNVIVDEIGTTTEGRDFLLAVVSSVANLAQLDQIKQHARTLADPRGKSEEDKRRAVQEGRVILFISPAMHSTETAATQFAMELAHRLATSNDEPYASAREKLVVCIFPNTNPDGLDHVCDWYRKTVGTPYEASEMLKLYQLYTGHDNNRDWFMLTQAETRIVTEQLYSEWFPQVYWDVHQQGSNRERMFVPPFRDPLNPNLDPAIIAGIDAIGSRALLDMTREGLTGISTGVTYDMWWNGGNRNVPVRHNIIGLLTEAASVRLASPIFLPRNELAAPGDLGGYAPSNQFPAPWPGGWWRLRDIIEYEHSFARSLLGSLAREPQTWLRNCLEASERTIAAAGAGGEDAAPRAWVIPSDNRDPAAVRRLVDVLLRSGVELLVAPGMLEADGRSYPPGSIVILRDQPYAAHVKDLLEVQRYPEGAPPYDVAGWTLPYLLGVRRVEVMAPLAPPAPDDWAAAASVDEATAAFAGDPRLHTGVDAGEPGGRALSLHESDSFTELARALQQGQAASVVHSGDRAGLVLFAEAPPNHESQIPAGEARTLLNKLPRIGIYSPWQGDMDEGWLRYVFDSFAMPYVSVRNEMVRAGALGDFLDVLIIPDVAGGALDRGRAEGTVHKEYAGGLAPEGAVAVEEFVRAGGTLITLGASSQWAIDLMRIPLIDVTREEANREFSCPGSVLRAIPEVAPLTAGLPDSLALFFARSSGWREMTEQERKDRNMTPDAKAPAKDGRSATNEDSESKAASLEGASLKTLLRYAPTRVLLSGWISKPEVIEGRSAWVRVAHGRGRVHLFAFQPQYRGWSQATFPLIFRAALLDAAKE